MRGRSANTQKIRVPGGSPPPRPSFTRGERAPVSGLERHVDTLVWLRSSVKGVAGWPGPSLDPYLLRVSEARTRCLVARQSGQAECDSAWSREGPGHPVAPV